MQRRLFSGELFTVGEFHAVPGDGLWGRELAVGETGSLVVFPRTAVRITQAGSDPVVANPTNAIFYDPARRYRRDPVDPRGDHCRFVGMSPATLAEAAAPFHPAALDDDPRAFRLPFSSGPVPADTFLLERQLARALDATDAADPLLVEETICRVVQDATGAAFRRLDRGPVPRPERSNPHHAELAEAAAALLSLRFRERSSLPELAHHLLSSPFHLARVFRARTGTTLHGYRTALRLRSVLDRLCEPGLDLSHLALAEGFSSHSHLTDTFRAVFGVAPSRVRRVARSADLAEMRTILEVRARPAT